MKMSDVAFVPRLMVRTMGLAVRTKLAGVELKSVTGTIVEWIVAPPVAVTVTL